MLTALRQLISDRRFRTSIEKYDSRMGPKLAAPFMKYLQKCRAAYTPREVAPELKLAAARFAVDGFATYWSERNKELADSILAKVRDLEASGTSPWDADLVFTRDAWREFPELEELFKAGLADFIESIYGANLKVFYAKLYKAVRSSPVPQGSQLWHSDGGPGTCINVMFYLSEGTRENGAMEIISWRDAKKIFADERSSMRQRQPAAGEVSANQSPRLQARERLTNWYKEQIAKRAIRVEQPTGSPGLVLAFRNNTIHKGGFPEEGFVRYVIVFHVYPSPTPLAYDALRQAGAAKRSGVPADPAF